MRNSIAFTVATLIAATVQADQTLYSDGEVKKIVIHNGGSALKQVGNDFHVSGFVTYFYDKTKNFDTERVYVIVTGCGKAQDGGIIKQLVSPNDSEAEGFRWIPGGGTVADGIGTAFCTEWLGQNFMGDHKLTKPAKSASLERGTTKGSGSN